MTQEMCYIAGDGCFLYLFLFLIDVKLEKCVTVLFPKIRFQYHMFLINITLKQMCDKAVDYCLTALKFVPDWFVASKMTK